MESVFFITENKIDVEEFLNSQQYASDGAQVLFLGKVRDLNLGKKVVAVSYQAHPVLAVKSFEKIASNVLKKYGSEVHLSICHRIGRLEIHEVSIAILVSSPHREEAYQVSRYVIEEIKHTSPIWKKEHYIEGDSEWLQGHALCGHAPHASL